ncbi:MAG: Stp1/IreP family PP2C-type Ser/Thr phosphatase [Candidatus Dadabacteria bacterium]|nr:Stp1/IreP family PP2C-type Ser/Thr phosphatase [Candidatus Dadabacteria bacterium]
MNIFKKIFKVEQAPKDELVYGATDVGMVRVKNEDVYKLVPEKGVYILADGMGGHNAGEVASSRAVDLLCEYFSTSRLTDMTKNPEKIREEMSNAIKEAHDKIVQLARTKQDYRGMGTTAVVVFTRNRFLHICHVGDSRVYVINESGISQVTNDHSSVGDLVRAGKISVEEARTSPLRSQINQAIGAPFVIAPEYNREPVSESDIVLMCSDGLWDMLSDEEIHSVVLDGETLEDMGNELIRRANEVGGEDNITVVLIQGEKLVE